MNSQYVNLFVTPSRVIDDVTDLPIVMKGIIGNSNISNVELEGMASKYLPAMGFAIQGSVRCHGETMKFVIDENSENQRLDIFLAEIMPEFSRSKIQNLIKDFETFKNKVSPILTDEVDPNLNKDPSETSQNELEISKIEADLIIINEDQQPSQSLQDSKVAFEKVVFKDSEFDHAPTNTKAAPVNTHEPTKDMQVVK
jgi:hypothetical protein